MASGSSSVARRRVGLAGGAPVSAPLSASAPWRREVALWERCARAGVSVSPADCPSAGRRPAGFAPGGAARDGVGVGLVASAVGSRTGGVSTAGFFVAAAPADAGLVGAADEVGGAVVGGVATVGEVVNGA